MKKVIVIGCPGSGKSSFSRALHAKTGIPLYHLDMMYWNADKTTVEKSLFLTRLEKVLSREEWIIDGNYASTLDVRLSYCDTVFFLDYPTEVCLSGIESRRGKPRPDMPWVELSEDVELTEFVKSYNTSVRQTVLSLLEKHSDKTTISFCSREDAEHFLNEEIWRFVNKI